MPSALPVSSSMPYCRHSRSRSRWPSREHFSAYVNSWLRIRRVNSGCCRHSDARNRVNRESTTRWSFNCRFKGLFTPYADKKLGEFFEPITMRAATRLGLSYRLPSGFSE